MSGPPHEQGHFTHTSGAVGRGTVTREDRRSATLEPVLLAANLGAGKSWCPAKNELRVIDTNRNDFARWLPRPH